MSYFRLEWTAKTTGDNWGGHMKNPTLDNVIFYLDNAFKYDGTVSLSIIDGPDTGPESLEVIIEKDRSIMTLLEWDGEDDVIRSFNSLKQECFMVEILGDYWDSRLICDDEKVIYAAFEELYKAGDVSREILN
jgi:hypothetical protein